MPYLIDQCEGDLARQMAMSPQWGLGMSTVEAAAVSRLEMWGSSFKDPGADWCELKAFDAQGALLKSRRVEGY